MKLGFVSAILPDLTLEQVLDFAAQEKFDCVELMCWPAGKAERRYAGITHVDVSDFGESSARAVGSRDELSAAVLCEVVSAVELIAGSLPLVSAVVVGLDIVEPSSALTDAASSEQPCIASTRIHRLREVILPAMVSVPGIRAVGARDRANALPHSGAASQRVSRPLWLRFE